MDIQAQILFTIAILNALFSYFIVRGENSAIKSLFSIFVLVVGAWSLGLAFFIHTSATDIALKISIFYYIAPALVVLIFLYFSLIFLKHKLSFVKVVVFLIPFLLLVVSFILDRNFLIKEINIIDEAHKEVVLNKAHYIYYIIYILFYIIVSYYFLIKAKLSKSLNTTESIQLNFIIAGTSISYFFAMLFNLFLPYFGNYKLIWLGPPFTIIMIGAMAYAILKHHLFDIKLVVTEILIFVLWSVMAIELFLAEGAQEIII